jgi:hypothetical protein
MNHEWSRKGTNESTENCPAAGDSRATVPLDGTIGSQNRLLFSGQLAGCKDEPRAAGRVRHSGSNRHSWRTHRPRLANAKQMPSAAHTCKRRNPASLRECRVDSGLLRSQTRITSGRISRRRSSSSMPPDETSRGMLCSCESACEQQPDPEPSRPEKTECQLPAAMAWFPAEYGNA